MLVVADHSLISAVPFLVPALIIIGYLAFHVVRDRRNPDDGPSQVGGAGWDEEGPGAPVAEKPAGVPDDPRA